LSYFLYGLFFVSCIVLVAAVLLQPGKTSAGALFTSNVSSTAFTPRGSASVLSKLTIIAATVFMLSALLLSMPALTGNISVLQTTGDSLETVAPIVDANANTQTDADAAVPANTETNAVAPANAESNANASEEQGIEPKPEANQP
jgi:preprotein translocase subunit SecG